MQNAPVRRDNTPKIMEEMERLNILFQKGRITLQYYDEQYEKLEKSLARNAEPENITIESYRHIEKTLTGNWKSFYDQLDYAHRKTFWKSIIEEIYIDKGTHKVCGFKFLINGCSI